MKADLEVTEDDPEESTGEHRRQVTVLDVLCVGGIVIATIRAFTTLFLAPHLLGTHPVLLELLRGSTSSMITAGAFARDGRADVVTAVVSGVIGLGFFSVFYWWAGRRYGNRILMFYTRHNPRYQRWVVKSERFLARWGGPTLIVQYYQPIPNILIYLGTGASGLPLWQFLLYNTLGCLAWVGLAVGLGYSIGTPAIDVAKQISHYSLYVTIGLIVVVTVLAYRRVAREMAAQAQKEATEDPAPQLPQ